MPKRTRFRQRPRGRAADERDDLAPPHSITSSARPDKGSGTVIPRFSKFKKGGGGRGRYPWHDGHHTRLAIRFAQSPQLYNLP